MAVKRPVRRLLQSSRQKMLLVWTRAAAAEVEKWSDYRYMLKTQPKEFASDWR